MKLTTKNAVEFAKRDFKNNDVADYQSEHAIEQGVDQNAACLYAQQITLMECENV